MKNMKICTICTKKHYGLGLCRNHYQQMKNSQRPKNPDYLRDMQAKERFKYHASPTPDNDGCVRWLGSTKSGGYGRMRFEGKIMLAHRVSYILKNGDIDETLHVLHKCDHPYCVNPDHLFLGTNSDNVADKMSKNRQSKMPGIKHPNAKLTEQQVLTIRDDKRSSRKIAIDYDLCRSTISYIKKRKLWSHL